MESIRVTFDTGPSDNLIKAVRELGREPPEMRLQLSLKTQRRTSKDTWGCKIGTSKPQRENKRKVLRVLIDRHEQLACADSGSEKNIISKELADDLNFSIRKGPKDIKRFELGNGKFVYSVGRVHIPVKLLGSSFGRKKRWYHVLQNYPVPLILGMPFLQEAEVSQRTDIYSRPAQKNCPIFRHYYG